MKKYLTTFFIIVCIILFHFSVLSAQSISTTGPDMLLEHVPTVVALQQQFYVDVVLDPNNSVYNGIEGTVSFSDNTLSFVRAETATSIVNYFIEQPTAVTNTIHFSGIMLGGFKGLINPFDPTHLLPGPVIRLVFVGKAPGTATIATSYIHVTDNDGQGTLENVKDATASLNVSSTVAPSMYTAPSTVPPTITASIVRDPNLFNNKYALVFDATDKQSGIDHVSLQEGSGPWITISSPYLLQDQSRQSILTLRAYDNAGNVTTITIAPIKTTTSPVRIIVGIILLIIVLITLLYVIYKKVIHKKVTRY